MDSAFDNLQRQVSLLSDDFDRLKIEIAEARSAFNLRISQLENREDNENARG
jgi:hypothetical protein